MDHSRKRPASPGFTLSSPLAKKHNLEWRISPPPFRNPGRRRLWGSGEEEQRAAEEGGGQCDENGNKQGPTEDTEGVGGKQDEAEKPKPCEEDLKDQEPVSLPITTKDPAAALSYPSSPSSLLEPSSTTQQPHKPEDAWKEDDDRHLAHFTHLLTTHALGPQASWPPVHPRLPIPAYAALYARHSRRADGAHFVVTQHDHPVAGPHYDLRLQIGPASSCSWAVMYGLPGDPNARGRTGGAGAGALRNATETRVHCLWNHLVESGGWATGSLLVWDTGVYEVLPPRRRPAAGGSGGRSRSARRRRDAATPPRDTASFESQSDSDFEQGRDGGVGSGASRWADMTQQQKLAASFASRKIRLRLRGARLPRNYVINLRMTREDDAVGRARAARATEKSPLPRRRRGEGGGGGGPQQQRQQQPQDQARRKRWRPNISSDTSSSGSEEEEEGEEEGREPGGDEDAGLSAMDRELRELEDAEVRRTNAYPGATNSIGSVHQRRWFLSLDAAACGFERTRRDGGRVWWEPPGSEEGIKDEADEENNNEDSRLRWPFYVLGPEHERSVVTGRLGADVLRDEGVVGYVGRKGWRPILH